MSLLHENSSETVDSGLDLFTIPPTQTSVEHGMYVEYYPLASLSPSSNIEFNINQKGAGEYVDLSNTYLYVRAKVTETKDNKVLADNAPVGPVNNWLHSNFSQVDVSFNNVLVTPSENTYPYRAYFENTLNYGKDAKKSQLSAEMYYKDIAHHFEEVTGAITTGMKNRLDRTAKSKEVDMIGRLHVDVMNMSKYVLSGVDIKIRLIRSKDDFNLMADPPEGTTYKTILTHVSLFVRKCKLNPVVMLAHEKALENNTAKYPLKRVTVKTFSVPTGNLSATQDNLFISQLPTRLIVSLVDSDAFNGTYKKNPFNFKHHNLSYIAVFVDGVQTPQKALTPDFKNRLYARSYHRLFTELGLGNKNEGNDIRYVDFDGGYCIFVFDLSPSILDGDQVELVKSGTLRLELKFSDPLKEPVHVLVYAEMDSLIEITKGREVITDYIG